MFFYLLNIPLPFHSYLDYCVWSHLSVCWKFVVPLYCGGFSLWVGLYEWLINVSWLGKLALVFWCVELDLFSLECNKVSSSEFAGVYRFGMAFCSLSFNVQGYVLVVVEN